MKFVDEVTIHTEAGKGGDGCLSFRREKFIPRGGPDGGNGGHGGSIYLQATSRLHTLVDLNYQKSYKAPNGKPGQGNLRSGKSGADLIIPVPIGTLVKSKDTQETIGDLINNKQLLLVAKGGHGGLGNYNFKSSTNRAPRKTTKGSLGEERYLHLELKLLADVGLVGVPNAGKSSIISQISSAKPKIADYPFTTINPNLGVVKINNSSFVIADIPGLITGASKGIGLGIKFLKHLARTKLLLQVIDLEFCLTDLAKIKQQIKTIEQELQQYSDQELFTKPRWLVINKIDLLTKTELNNLQQLLINNKINVKIFFISAINNIGLKKLCSEVIKFLNK